MSFKLLFHRTSVFSVNIHELTCRYICRSEPVLPTLTFAQKRGNVTFYEWRTGKVPTVVERPAVEEAAPDTATDDAVGLSVSMMCNNQKHTV